MGEEDGRIRITDKRKAAPDGRGDDAETSAAAVRPSPEGTVEGPDASSAGRPRAVSDAVDALDEGPGVRDAGSSQPPDDGTDQDEASDQDNRYLEDLRRVQAEFDNYRKRVLREQTNLSQRASARLVERLLPILDNFESAIAHGEGGTGVEMVHRELRRVLEDEGLEEIPAQGAPFDPMHHEAFEAVEDENAEEPRVRAVLRRGYSLKGQVLRPAMVSVARPPERSDSEDKDAAEG